MCVCVHAYAYVCVHVLCPRPSLPRLRALIPPVWFFQHTGSVGPQGLRGEVGLPGAKGKLRGGPGGEEGYHCVDATLRKEAWGDRQGLVVMTSSLCGATGDERKGQSALQESLSSDSHSAPSWSSPPMLFH